MALTPRFTRADIKAKIDTYLDRVITATVEALKDVGEGFITDCRNLRTYQDQTGNLRASIGYIILVRGKMVTSVFDTGTSAEGRRIGLEYAKKIGAQFSDKNIVFVGVAGMEYAVAVESRGLDVITGSSNEATKLLNRHIKRITKK